jgi:hypothetical protein
MRRFLLVFAVTILLVLVLPPADVAATPPAPTSIQATDGTMVNFIRVTWSLCPGALYYKVYRGYPLPKDDYLIATVPNTSTTFDDTTADHEKLYAYRVAACDPSGCNRNLWAYDYGHAGRQRRPVLRQSLGLLG